MGAPLKARRSVIKWQFKPLSLEKGGVSWPLMMRSHGRKVVRLDVPDKG
ncbi:MAG: hypothetical protein ACI835_004328 [Planctomycetota bacterium]|jgi:hypothetical protein